MYNKSFESGFLFRSEESRLFQSLIKNVHTEDHSQIQRFAQQIKEVYAKPWQIIVFFKASEETAIHLYQKLPLALRTPYNCSLSDKYLITLMRNLTTDEFEIFDNILKDSNLRGGISYSFTELDKVHHYVKQSISALEASTQMDSPFGLATYEEYLLTDIILHSKSELLPYKLQHPVLRELHDHAPHLYRTLQIYVQENCKTARASEVLHMHKNSVLYQLKQISEIAGYDVTSVESIASLRYAFAIEQFLTFHTR